MKLLYVYFEKHLVGKLYRDEEFVYSFTYEPEWQKHPDAFPLSLAMPLSQNRFENRLTLSFFENLLPEGDVRESLGREHGVTGVFSFLENYGQDCSGAIVVTAQPDYIQAIDPHKMIKINWEDIYNALDANRSLASMIADMNPGYLSLAGAQDKFPLVYRDDAVFIPTAGGPTTHIIKASIHHSGIKESVFNEYFCMELARRVGLNVPPCFVHPGRHPLFVIERYDRQVDSAGEVHRIHQQDFCQALGLISEFKYEDKGGPTLKNNYDLILQNVTSVKRIDDIRNFLTWLAFNLIIGNHDCHAKNISFIFREKRTICLAPFYDLLCTSIYPYTTRRFPYKIGGRDNFDTLGLTQITQFEESIGIKRGAFRKVLQDVNQKIHLSKKEVVADINQTHPEVKITQRISQLIEERAKSLQLQGVL